VSFNGVFYARRQRMRCSKVYKGHLWCHRQDRRWQFSGELVERKTLFGSQLVVVPRPA
jgi:hypothetical protein